MSVRRNAARWLFWLALLALATAAMVPMRGRLDKAHVVLTYLLIVLGSSGAVGRTLGLVVAGAAFLAFDFLFLPPYYTFVVADPLDWLVLFTFLVTSAVAAQLLYRARVTAEAATQRAAEVNRLSLLGAETLNAATAEEALHAIAAVIRASTGVDSCDVYRRNLDGEFVRATRATTSNDWDGGGDIALIAWIAGSARSAAELMDGTVHVTTLVEGTSATVDGADFVTRTPGVRALLLPLVVREHTVGVLRIVAMRGLVLSPESASMLVALAYYAALGVERVRLVETAERAEAERRVESLRSALLTAVSHDLRTPLTTIKAIAHEVASGGARSRVTVIEAEVDRLDALISDLLDLSRIHAGAVLPAIELNTVDDLVGAAMQGAAGLLDERAVTVDSPQDALLTARFDFSQTLRALVNLLENAAKYAPPGTPILIRVRREEDRLTISVLDRGPGVAASEREQIFEPFYRPPGTPADVRGTGLGLSIARGLVEAQGGALRYEPRPDGGSMFVMELPAVDAPLPEPVSHDLPE